MDTPGAGPSASSAQAGHWHPLDTGSRERRNDNVINTEDRAPRSPLETSAPERNTSAEELSVFCKCYKNPKRQRRNLVVCIDGTANQFSFKNSNVVELYSRLDKDETQLTYYNSGVGTFVKDSNRLSRLKQGVVNGWDMAVAWNLKKIVLNAYRWLSDNYQPGDRIFLFGFSRGAYQVRIIAGMITTVGLLHKGNDDQIAFAYELYLANISRSYSRRSLRKLIAWFRSIITRRPVESPQGSEDPLTDSMAKIKDLSEMFKETLSNKHATVHLVGIWDTVSSVGITRGQSFPETVHGMTNVCGCRHAISLDELRDKFLPEYLNGGAGPVYSRALGRNLDWQERLASISTDNDPKRVKEVWFVGSHSDIGGGNSENVRLNSFGPPLRWMLYESLQYGLKVGLGVKGWGQPEHNPSMTKIWRILEIYPFRRLTYKHPDETKRWPPHFSRGRRMQEGQLIHESVVRYMKDHPGYTPAARNPRDKYDNILGWDDVRALTDTPDYIEKDADSPAIEILAQLCSAARKHGAVTATIIAPFLELATTVRGGSQSIIDATVARGESELLFQALELTVGAPPDAISNDARDRMIAAIATALALFPSISRDTPRYHIESLNSWLDGVDIRDRKQITNVFAKESIDDPIHGHTSSIYSVAYSPNGKLIASGAGDNTLRLWNAQTGHPYGQPIRGHANVVRSVTFSPDGTRVASASDDGTIRLWDVATQNAVGSPLTGHARRVMSVAFLPDGKHVVSGLTDQTVRIWATETARMVGEPLRGHGKDVQSVAFSSDRRHIASGSLDTTVRVWDSQTREVVRVLEGHSDCVFSVVFTPDGKRVISGSRDRTIRVWDADLGVVVLDPLRGHQDAVRAVAISGNGKYIVSGSKDKTIRLWNAETGQAIGDPLRGHTEEITSVAFSLDSRWVVSGSNDKTLMIWDVDGLLNDG